LHQRNVYNLHLLPFLTYEGKDVNKCIVVDNDSLNPKLHAMCGNNEIGFACLATNITKVIEVVEEGFRTVQFTEVVMSCFEWLFRRPKCTLGTVVTAHVAT
jgi:hypothetical protein